jgi:hypothetical protein
VGAANKFLPLFTDQDFNWTHLRKKLAKTYTKKRSKKGKLVPFFLKMAPIVHFF